MLQLPERMPFEDFITAGWKQKARQEQIVEAARSLVGVPYHHQGRHPRFGLDCVGLLAAVYELCGVEHHDFTCYRPQPDPHVLLREIAKGMDRIERAELTAGDVVCFWTARRGVPQHFGVLTETEPLNMVHAWAQVGKVAEHRLDVFWYRRRHSFWRFRI